MKTIKVWVQIGAGLLLAFVVMCARGLFAKTGLSNMVMAVGDGFTVAAFLYLGMGTLIRVASTGWFDIFSFAIKRGVHALMPNLFPDNISGYYEYKVKKSEKRKRFTEYSILKLGAVFLVVSMILTIVWYMTA